MGDFGIIGFFLLICNAVASYKGLTEEAFMNRHSFWVSKILFKKEWGRLVSSGFIHASWPHLLMNMLALHCFSNSLEASLGPLQFLLLYAISLLFGSLLSLYLNRNKPDYQAVGASGAICGIVFAQICLDPSVELGLIGIPYYFPGWLFGLLYVLFCLWGIRNNAGNIGHDAHLGGALAGIFTAIWLVPATIAENWAYILSMLLPVLAFLLYVVLKPGYAVSGPSPLKVSRGHTGLDDAFFEQRKRKQQKLDLLLEKIHECGLDSLTKKEREFLDAFAEREKHL